MRQDAGEAGKLILAGSRGVACFFVTAKIVIAYRNCIEFIGEMECFRMVRKTKLERRIERLEAEIAEDYKALQELRELRHMIAKHKASQELAAIEARRNQTGSGFDNKTMRAAGEYNLPTGEVGFDFAQSIAATVGREAKLQMVMNGVGIDNFVPPTPDEQALAIRVSMRRKMLDDVLNPEFRDGFFDIQFGDDEGDGE